MGSRVSRSFTAAWVMLFVSSGAVAAQQGTVTGVVTNAETGEPISAAQIQVLGGPQATGTLSDNQGRYRTMRPTRPQDRVISPY